jgi:hypothetical protein
LAAFRSVLDDHLADVRLVDAVGPVAFAGRARPANAAYPGVPWLVRVVLGEDEDWLSDVASEMDAEDGRLWVYGVGEDGVMAFTDFGVETLTELIRIHKENPHLLRRQVRLRRTGTL